MKKIILVGPACAGKSFIKNILVRKGYVPDVSYTSRPKRDNEKDGADYHFVSEERFLSYVEDKHFYEHVKHGGHYYGTSLYHWNTAEVFIMEADGIGSIEPEDRKRCLVVFVTAPQTVRTTRMRDERGWDDERIKARILVDANKFEGFKDYDLVINSVDEM